MNGASRLCPQAAGVAPEAIAALIRGRRSIDRFAPEPPPAALIAEAVEVARWAPNHKLTQPWRFYLLGPETVAGVIGLNRELVAASRNPQAAAAKARRWATIPGWLLLTRMQTDDPLRAREDYAACACAAQNCMLYLASAGVASKWTTGKVTREPRFYDLVGIDPALEETVALLWYGYPAHTPRMRRRPVREILTRLP